MNKTKIPTIFSYLCLICFCAFEIRAQVNSAFKQDSVAHKLVLNFSMVDLPYGFYASQVKENTIAGSSTRTNHFVFTKSFALPSMEQSTQLSLNTRYAIFFGVKTLFKRKASDTAKKKIWKASAVIFTNTLMDLVIPFGSSWQHEEFHRAAMAHFGTYSNNSLNDWITGKKNANTASVSGVNSVLDTNLSLIKTHSNADFVRMMSAGGEGEVYGAEHMQQNTFFYNTGFLNSLSLMYRFISVQQYIAICSKPEAIKSLITAAEVNEGSNQSLRDFTGADYAAWAYDLNHPTLPYAARGQNPRGNGYDRYIYDNKLTRSHYAWLRQQSQLALLNILSPLNFFVSSITLKKFANSEHLKGNFAFRYYPTSFGNQIGLNLFLKKGRYKLFMNPALNQNFQASFPSLEVALIDYVIHPKFSISTRVIIWEQPKNQTFNTNKGEFGALLSATTQFVLNKYLHPYFCLGYKTKGWVAGSVFLEKTYDFKFGLRLLF